MFCAQLLVLAVVLHRFDFLSSPVAVNLLSVALLGGIGALIVAIVSLTNIWQYGLSGAGRAVFAMVIALVMFALPVWHLPDLLLMPAINDVTTDTELPPRFDAIARLRPDSANEARYPGEKFAVQQAVSYPDVQPLVLERSNVAAYELVREAAQGLGWEIVENQPPANKRAVGHLEAIDRTLLMGFADDVVVRVEGDENRARIDVRSASRYGRHDFGVNARRIRGLLQEVKTRLAKAEAAQAEEIARVKARREELRRKKEHERKARLKAAKLKKQNYSGRRGFFQNRPPKAVKPKIRKRRKIKRRQQWNPFGSGFFGN